MITKLQLGSSWTENRDKFLDDSLDLLKNEGIQIFVSSDIFPEIKVYDSSIESSGKSLVDVGVRVVNRSGKVLANYGDAPKINTGKALLLYGGIGALLFFTFKGIKG